MRRREFVTFIGGAAAWPIAARAQQSAVPVIGWLSSGSPKEFESFVAAFQRGLGELGFVEGRNIAVQYRWAEGRYDRLPALAADLVARHVALIAATGGSASSVAAKAATATIPIVFTGGGDPVQLGLVKSLNRPGENATGAANITSSLDGKRLELTHELVLRARAIVFLANSTNPSFETVTADVRRVARALGIELPIVKASNEGEIDAAFVALAKQRPDAVVVATDAYFTTRREQLVMLAAQLGIPTTYTFREFVTAGGLMSYGPSATEGYRQAGVYAGRILKGEKPADLPVIQPTQFDLVLNLKTARAVGLDIPPLLLARADEVIE
jgi:putative tryptophan/tyrosine transport system substrate-binding protein